MTPHPAALSAFSAFGIELEYMIVDSKRLSVLPIADRLLQATGDSIGGEVDRGLLGWSNEMVLHLVELKNQRPTAALEALAPAFQREVSHINRLLEALGGQLMPSAMHPLMDPRRDTRLWPHHNAAIYQSYARIFDCNTHGWANLQSMHINLPFAGDDQFARLHAAVRLALPILPALAASSPIAEGRDTGFADYRMEAYRSNSGQFPAIAGQVIPESVESIAAYHEQILAPMYREIAPFDPDRILQHEWLNSRGAIARFDRNAIEIRVVDVQECPQADLAIAAAGIALTRKLYETDAGRRHPLETKALSTILQCCIRDADQARISDRSYLQAVGYDSACCSAGELWQGLIEEMQKDGCIPSPCHQPLQIILKHGPLARRILRALGGDLSENRLHKVYRELCDCLQQGRMFIPS